MSPMTARRLSAKWPRKGPMSYFWILDCLDENIRVQVVEVQRGRVRLGISAPSDVHVLRSELFAADEEKRRLALAGAGSIVP